MSKKEAPPPPPATLQEFIARLDEKCTAELNRQRKPHKGLSVTVHGFFDFDDFPADMFRDMPES
jgi:hypothetical protein